MKINIPPFLPFTCSCVLFTLLQDEAFFWLLRLTQSVAPVLYPNCNSSFCKTVFSQPFFLRLGTASEPPLMPPRTTQSLWMWVRGRDWWERESRPERVQRWRVENKLSNVEQMREPCVPKLRQRALWCHWRLWQPCSVSQSCFF